MCIAIWNPSDGDKLDADDINKAYNKNSHGLSVSWVDNGKIKSFKSMCRRDLIYQKYLELRAQDHDVVFHFRNATRGEVNLQNCHPHYVREDMIVVHNGTIRMNGFDKKEAENSDTKEFCRRLTDIFTEGFEENEDAMDMIGDFIDHSKLLFLRADGEHFIVNKGKGNSVNGNWFSNYQIRGYKTGRKGYARNKGYTSGTTSNYRREDDEDDDENSKQKDEQKEQEEDESVDEPKSGKEVEGDVHVHHPPTAYRYHGYTVCDYCLPDCVERDELDKVYGGSSGVVYCDNCDHIISPSFDNGYSSTGSVRK